MLAGDTAFVVVKFGVPSLCKNARPQFSSDLLYKYVIGQWQGIPRNFLIVIVMSSPLEIVYV